MNQYHEKVAYKLGDSATCLDVSGGGSFYAAGLLDESVVLWKGGITKENEENLRLEGHGLGVIDIKFSEDESQLAVSSLDSVIRIWDMHQSIKLREISCQQMENWKLAYIDNHTICTAGQGGKVTLFDSANGQELQSFSVENSFATAIDNNQYLLAVCTSSGSLHVVEDSLNKHKLYHLPKLHKKLVRTVKFSQCGTRTLSGSDDQEIKMVDLASMKCIRSFLGHQGSVSQIDINPVDSKLFASCAHDGVVKLWDMSTGQCIDTFQPFEKKTDCIWGLKFSFDGSLIGVCNQAGALSFFSH